MKYVLCSFLVSTSLIGGLWNRDIEPKSESVIIQEEKNCCYNAPRPMRISARYTSRRGIGYSKGYTTVEGFFSHMVRDRWLPFLDLRGHVFDNGHFATNAGLGFRYLDANRILGFNVYYDYRDLPHHHYNQIAAGFESLGGVWDFRINGYLPLGTKNGSFRHAKFKRFSGHHMFIRARRDFALEGINAEIGLHVDRFKSAPLYFNGGPYYLHCKRESTWGGQLRGAVDLFCRYLRLEANVSYDHFFKWIGQGQVSVNIPFRKRVSLRTSDSCETTLYTRSVQKVDRYEIIPEARIHETFLAIDPVIGEPYFFVFINNLSNLSSSNGTFENPYPTLLLGQNNSSPRDILYVFPGNGTSTGLNGGIILQDSQMLLGAGTLQELFTTVGNISIPPQAPIMPVLTINNGTIITLANNNLISGLYIQNVSVTGILGNNISNFTCLNNMFIGTNLSGSAQQPIRLSNFSGLLTVENNFFSQLNLGLGDSTYIFINQNSPCNLNINNNTFEAHSTSMALARAINFFLTGNVAVGRVGIENNNFVGYGLGGALLITLNNSCSVSNVVINNSNANSWGNTVQLILNQDSTVHNLSITNSNFNVATQTGLNISGSGSVGSLNIQNSNFIANNVSVFYGGTTIINKVFIENNQFTGGGTGGLQFTVRNPSSMSILNNQFTGLTTGGTAGYAADITTIAGSNLCLDFFNNTTVPTQIGANAPYRFTRTAGTFNKTERSTQENNIGTIQTVGSIGTCSIEP